MVDTPTFRPMFGGLPNESVDKLKRDYAEAANNYNNI
jgi:hypothetical protein